jgi:competence ComEA-like helix-hairpin-helix protein
MTPKRAAATVVVAVVAVFVGAASRACGGGPPAVLCENPGMAEGRNAVCDGSGTPLGKRAWLFGQKLDLNTASAASLARIRGVGPSVAEAIVRHREEHGPFTDVSELDDVKGIGPKLMATVAAAAEVRATPPPPTTTTTTTDD